MGTDGNDIYLTRRCLFSLIFGYNTVNFGRLSPSYEWRLSKYGFRGMKVRIPGFDRSKVRKSLTSLNHLMYPFTKSIKLRGIDILLFCEMKFYTRGNEFRGQYMKLASDYDEQNSAYFDPLGNILGQLKHIRSKEINKEAVKRCLISRETDMIITEEIHPRRVNKNMEYYKGFRFENKDHVLSFVCWNIRISNIFIETGNFEESGIISRVQSGYKFFPFILNIPKLVYQATNCLVWNIPRKVHFQEIDPGSQVTGTFHKIVLKDNSEWFKGEYYE